MRMKWKKTAAALLASTLTLSTGYSAFANDEPAQGQAESALADSAQAADAGSTDTTPSEAQAPAPAEPPVASLTDAIQAQIKSLLDEHTLNGTRIAAVIKLSNNTDETVRVPDFELRAVTDGGAKYVLRPDASNAPALQPWSTAELSYMAVVDRQDAVAVQDLLWVDVNKDVYPKVETTMLDMPAGDFVWTGDDDAIVDPGAQIAWGKTFTIPLSNSPLTYSPIGLSTDHQSSNPVKVIKFKVDNPTDQSENIPSFVLNGKDGSLVYRGTRADQGPATLNPGESKYIYYAVPTEQDTELTSVDLLTPETFHTAPASPQGTPTVTTYYVGRLNIALPEQDVQPTSITAVNDGKTPIALDPLNDVFPSDISVVTPEVRLYENKGEGYQTAIVKFLLTNGGQKPLAVPAFGSDIVTSGDVTYEGRKVNSAAATIEPQTSYVVEYAYVLPLSFDGKQFTIRLLDGKTSAPYSSVIAQLNASVPAQKAASVSTDKSSMLHGGKLSLYPYTIDMKDWHLSYSPGMNPTTGSYRYTFKLDTTWNTTSLNSVVTDNNSSRLLMEIVNDKGQILSTQALDVSGANRINDGDQSVYFTSDIDHLDLPLKLNVYEAIDTPNGQARHLLATLKP